MKPDANIMKIQKCWTIVKATISLPFKAFAIGARNPSRIAEKRVKEYPIISELSD